MITKFLYYIKHNHLLLKENKVLLTISGGKDSMAMLHLFVEANYSIGVAHCNFQLRGKDANDDELFVEQTCQRLNIPFHSIKFDTLAYAKKNKISTQMAARKLRYQWFEKIKSSYCYDFIVTAHHQNDVAETMLINLAKGTGLSGLHGIKNKINSIVRPLLCFNSSDIQQYIHTNSISFREDKSNASTKYVRNKIRHKILPQLAEINPTVVETLNQSAQHFLAIENILAQKIDDEKKRCFSVENEKIKINIKQLQQLNPLSTYLYYFLLPFHFNFDDCEQIEKSVNSSISGKQFYSNTHLLIKDRDSLLISETKTPKKSTVCINSIADFNKSPIKMKASIIKNENVRFDESKKIAYLDADKIFFPLHFRKWKEGDKFTPFGMKGKKKVSDFFVDEKFSIPQKNETWLLIDKNDAIIWVVNARTDNNFKVKNNTKNILVLEIFYTQ